MARVLQKLHSQIDLLQDVHRQFRPQFFEFRSNFPGHHSPHFFQDIQRRRYNTPTRTEHCLVSPTPAFHQLHGPWSPSKTTPLQRAVLDIDSFGLGSSSAFCSSETP